MSVRTHLPASSPPGGTNSTVHCRVTLVDTERRRPLAGWIRREDVPCQKTSLVRRRPLSEDVPCQGGRVDP